MRTGEGPDIDDVFRQRDRERPPRHAARPWLLVALFLVLVLPADVGGQEWIVAPAPRPDRDMRGPRPEKPPGEDLLAINGALFGALQWVANSNVAQGSVFGAGSLDLTLTVRPTETMRIFLDVLGLLGQGPNERLTTLQPLNKNSDDTLGKDKTLRVMKLIVRQSWLEDRILLSVGKIDVEDYFDRNAFAEDEGSQFLSAALLTSPMLRSPLNGLGGALRVSWGDWRYALGVHGQDDIDGKFSGLPMILGEVGHRNIFKLDGHYRWWARVNGLPEERDRVSWGTGVSIDQLVTSNIGVFFRAGLSRTQGESGTAYAWSAGAQFTPPWFGGKDAIGAGYSHQQEVDSRERVAEVYYRFGIADWLTVIANVQWITGGENRNLVIPGLRALLQF